MKHSAKQIRIAIISRIKWFLTVMDMNAMTSAFGAVFAKMNGVKGTETLSQESL